MNRTFRFFIATLCFAPLFSASAAFQVKKAAPVETKSSAGSDSAASLAPNVIGLVSGVMEINAKQNALSGDCEPSRQEMDFVDNTIKEWAKSGQISLTEIKDKMSKANRSPCGNSEDVGKDYENDLPNAQAINRGTCYNHFVGPGNDKMVWYDFPRTGKGTYCKSNDPLESCSGKNKATMSDAYDLFNLVDFGPADYTPSEATMAAKLLSKVESCSSSKLNAKKRALWGEFLVNTAGGLGKKTDTSAIMQQVGNISSSGGVGAIGSLGSVASQLMNK